MSISLDSSGGQWFTGHATPSVIGIGNVAHTLAVCFKIDAVPGSGFVYGELASLTAGSADTYTSAETEAILVDKDGKLCALVTVNATQVLFITGPVLTVGTWYTAALVTTATGVVNLYYTPRNSGVAATLAGTSTTPVSVAARTGNLGFINTQTYGSPGFAHTAEHLMLFGSALDTNAINTLARTPDQVIRGPATAGGWRTPLVHYPFYYNYTWADFSGNLLHTVEQPTGDPTPNEVNDQSAWAAGATRIGTRWARHARVILPTYDRNGRFAVTANVSTNATANVVLVLGVSSTANTTTACPSATIDKSAVASTANVTTAATAAVTASAAATSTANVTTAAPTAAVTATASVASTANAATNATTASVTAAATVASTANATTAVTTAAVTATAVVTSTANVTTAVVAAVTARASVVCTADVSTACSTSITATGNNSVVCIANATTACAAAALDRVLPIVSTANATTAASATVSAGAPVATTANATTAASAAVTAQAAVASTANATTAASAAATASAAVTSTANATTAASATVASVRLVASVADVSTSATGSVGLLVIRPVEIVPTTGCNVFTGCLPAAIYRANIAEGPGKIRDWPPHPR